MNFQKNSLSGVELGPWTIVCGHCATRALLGSDPTLVENRIAFIEKTPRVLLNGEWVQGPKGNGGDFETQDVYGKDPDSRAWCDTFLIRHGAVLET